MATPSKPKSKKYLNDCDAGAQKYEALRLRVMAGIPREWIKSRASKKRITVTA